MHLLLARGPIGAAALSLGLALPGLASAADPVKPAAGDPVLAPPAAPKAEPGGASTGSSANPPASPDDERSARDREEDERRATESKDKMKKRPGYKDNVPAPRV